MILDILEYPDPRLRKVAAPVAVVTADIRKLVRDLAETMYAAPGIGLAATQVNVHKRIIVIDVSPTHDDLKVLINPELVSAEGEDHLVGKVFVDYLSPLKRARLAAKARKKQRIAV